MAFQVHKGFVSFPVITLSTLEAGLDDSKSSSRFLAGTVTLSLMDEERLVVRKGHPALFAHKTQFHVDFFDRLIGETVI